MTRIGTALLGQRAAKTQTNRGRDLAIPAPSIINLLRAP
jgi:hypothetical protein